jgi:hypothetical protein
MKTTESREHKHPKTTCIRSDNLYPNVGDLKRLESAYKRLGLDYTVLRATPREDEPQRRRA